jgi:hypothetical protein
MMVLVLSFVEISAISIYNDDLAFQKVFFVGVCFAELCEALGVCSYLFT